MRAILTAIILFSISASAQVKKQKPGEQIFEKIEINAHTDRAQFARYLMRHITLPDSLIEEKGVANLTVVVSFIVDQYGRVTDVKAESDPGYGLGARAVKIIKNYPGSWTPAVQCGRQVKSYKKEIIRFCLAAD